MRPELDIYPATLQIGDGPPIRRVRVMAGNGKAVAIAGQGEVVASGEALSVEKARSRSRPNLIETPEGAWKIYRGSCSCTSPLGRFNPAIYLGA